MVKLYVEGGGDAGTLKTACRKGFSSFLEKAGLSGHLPKVVACGGRKDAFDSFCTALAHGEPAMLLIDSEAPVIPNAQTDADRKKWLPWLHLKQREGDKWEKPAGADDLQCHLMTQCMESWLLADRATLKEFFGQGFKENQLPAAANPVESLAKIQIYQSLAKATADCKTKAQYGKGEHSFKLLALIDPAKIMDASPWAKRFVEAMKANN